MLFALADTNTHFCQCNPQTNAKLSVHSKDVEYRATYEAAENASLWLHYHNDLKADHGVYHGYNASGRLLLFL